MRRAAAPIENFWRSCSTQRLKSKGCAHSQQSLSMVLEQVNRGDHFFFVSHKVIFLVSQNASFALEIGYFGERSERPSERQRASFPLNMRLKRLGLKNFACGASYFRAAPWLQPLAAALLLNDSSVCSPPLSVQLCLFTKFLFVFVLVFNTKTVFLS